MNAPLTEAATRADFSAIRYAQCWEDADILLDGLNVQSGDVCLSIASAGDNSLSMLARDAAKVVAVDLNPAQLACVRLRIAAYRQLEHGELLELIGSRRSDRRIELYEKCVRELDAPTREFWSCRKREIQNGIGSAGKFENYFRVFRQRVVPLIHSRKRVDALLRGGDKSSRRRFFDRTWNNLRWRLLFKIFFSRTLMGKLGRDPAFFQYVEGSVADRIAQRVEHALTELNPCDNPYLHWILKGTHGDALPHALRAENFDLIRNRLDRLEVHQLSIEQYLDQHAGDPMTKYNLSDIFEYMSAENTAEILKRCIEASRSDGRLAYWNMLVPRSRPEDMAPQIRSLDELSRELFLRDKAFFYSRFVVEEVI